jgi:hypothetical protein
MIDPASSALNLVVVNGVPSPGRATVIGAAVPYKYDIKEGYGLSGATTTYHGRGVAKFTLHIDIWAREHFLAWPLFKKLLEPPKPSLPLVVEMQHPVLSDQGISKVAVESMGALERQSNGLWRCTIQLLEWRPPVPALVKPRGAIPGVAKGKPIPPKTEADLALEKARVEFEAARNAARGGA